MFTTELAVKVFTSATVWPPSEINILDAKVFIVGAKSTVPATVPFLWINARWYAGVFVI